MSSMKVTKNDVAARITKASALLLKEVPTLPMPAGAMMAAADKAQLPIGREDIDADPVARAIFLTSYVKEARDKIEEAIDAVWKLFRGNAMAAA